MIHAVLNQMVGRKEGAIINVSSLGAYMPGRGASMYAATKVFLKSFTESLSIELRQSGVRFQSLCPGLTRTNFHNRRSAGKNGISKNRLMWMDAEDVVDISQRSLKRGVVVCIPGWLNKILATMVSLAPRRLYYGIAGKSAQAKVTPGLFDRCYEFVEKAVPFFFTAKTDQVRLPD